MSKKSSKKLAIGFLLKMHAKNNTCESIELKYNASELLLWQKEVIFNFSLTLVLSARCFLLVRQEWRIDTTNNNA